MRKLKHMNVRGVILEGELGYGFDLSTLLDSPDMDWDAFAWVSAGENRYAHACSRVLKNSFENILKALAKLEHYGYQRIAVIRESSHLGPENVRQHGAVSQYKESHPQVEILDIQIDSAIPSPEQLSSCQAFQPDALLLGYRHIHPHLGNALQKLPYCANALRLGTDDQTQSIAGIYEDEVKYAHSILSTMDSKIRQLERGIPDYRESVMIDFPWIDGESLPNLRHSDASSTKTNRT